MARVWKTTADYPTHTHTKNNNERREEKRKKLKRVCNALSRYTFMQCRCIHFDAHTTSVFLDALFHSFYRKKFIWISSFHQAHTNFGRHIHKRIERQRVKKNHTKNADGTEESDSHNVVCTVITNFCTFEIDVWCVQVEMRITNIINERTERERETDHEPYTKCVHECKKKNAKLFN